MNSSQQTFFINCSLSRRVAVIALIAATAALPVVAVVAAARIAAVHGPYAPSRAIGRATSQIPADRAVR